MKVLSLIVCFLLLTISPVMAEKGKSITHNHGNRTHSHPLPAEGLNHSHNKPVLHIKKKSKKSSEWVLITKTLRDIYKTKIGSFKTMRTDNGDEVPRIIISRYNIASRNTYFTQDWVSPTDCNEGYGRVNATNMQGRPIFTDYFVAGGGNVASAIADTICAALNAQDKKIKNISSTKR